MRQVEIDDRMPCNSDKQYILPKCINFNPYYNSNSNSSNYSSLQKQIEEHPKNLNNHFYFQNINGLSELWPGLICKAILKLFSYKFNSKNYIDMNDHSIIYALTGFIPENLISHNHLMRSINCFLDNDYLNQKSKKSNIEENSNKRTVESNTINENINKKTVETIEIIEKSYRGNTQQNTFLLVDDQEKSEYYNICSNILKERKFVSQQKFLFCYHLNLNFNEEQTNQYSNVLAPVHSKVSSVEKKSTFNINNSNNYNNNIVNTKNIENQNYITNNTGIVALDKILVNFPYPLVDYQPV